jgi:hypothetical protein
MGPNEWKIIRENKMLPEYLENVTADFVPARVTRQNMAQDSHLIELPIPVLDQEADPDLDPDPDDLENLPIDSELMNQLNSLHADELLTGENMSLDQIPKFLIGQWNNINQSKMLNYQVGLLKKIFYPIGYGVTNLHVRFLLIKMCRFRNLNVMPSQRMNDVLLNCTDTYFLQEKGTTHCSGRWDSSGEKLSTEGYCCEIC